MMPICGSRIERGNLTVIDDVEQDREWQALYEALKALLGRHGRDDPHGKGDYWLIEDNYGCFGHKVEVHQPGILTHKMAQQVQELLSMPTLRNPWYVIISLGLDDKRFPKVEGAIKVTADRIEEHWNIDRIRSILGADFRWP